MSKVQLLDQGNSLVIQLLLLILHLSENVYSRFRVDELFGVEFGYELLDGIVLLQFVESDHALLPGLVKNVKFAFLGLNYLEVEVVKFYVLKPVLLVFVINLLLHQLIHSWS